MKDLKKCYHNCSKCGKRYETTGDWPEESRCFFCFILEEELSPPKKGKEDVRENTKKLNKSEKDVKAELLKEVIKLIKEAEECGDQYGMLYEMIKIHFKKGKE